MNISELEHRIIEAKDEYIMMSVKNCHTYNVYSFVLNQTIRGLHRVFIADTSHLLWYNYPGTLIYSVGPHTHRYNVFLNHIYGMIRNYIYEENQSAGEFMYKWDVKTTINSNENSRFSNPERSRILNTEIQNMWIVDQKSQYLLYHTIHSMYIPKGEMAIWEVEELGVGPIEKTALYNHHIQPLENGYQKFNSPEEARKTALNLINKVLIRN